MAEHVQATLDRMVDGLIAIRDYGNDFFVASTIDRTTSTTTAITATNSSTVTVPPPLISNEEMAIIIGRRRSYEYLLRRRQPRQSDFLLYLQYELQLYELIQLRYKKYYQSNKAFQRYLHQQKQKQQQRHDADVDATTGSPPKYHKKPVQYIIQHIHTLYQRTIRQYRYSYTIVQQYVEFCKVVAAHSRPSGGSGSNTSPATSPPPALLLPPYSSTITKIYQNAIKYHCTNVQLWYDMIQYEYQYYQQECMNEATSTARIGTLRILFQRALRFHSQNVSLWKAFITMEWNHCHYHMNDSNDDDDDDEVKGDTNEIVDTNKETNSHPTNRYKIIQILYDSAMKAILDTCSNLSFRIQCYQVVLSHATTIATSSSDENRAMFQQHILDSILQLTKTTVSSSTSTSASSVVTSNTINTTTHPELFVIVRATMLILQQQQPPSNHTSDKISESNNPVLQIIQEACHIDKCSDSNSIDVQASSSSSSSTVPTINMIYYALQFLRSYFNHIVAKRRDQNPSSASTTSQPLDNTLIQIQDLICDIYTTYNNNCMVLSSNDRVSYTNENGVVMTWADIVYEFVMFIVHDMPTNTTNMDDEDASRLPSTTSTTTTTTGNPYQKAIQILQDYIHNQSRTVITTQPIPASLFLLLAKLTIDDAESNIDPYVPNVNQINGDDNSEKYDSAIVLLEQAIQFHVPIHQQPDHLLLLEQLLCLYVAKLIHHGQNNVVTTTVTTINENQNHSHVLIKIKQLLDQIILVGPQQLTEHTKSKRQRNVAVVRHIPNILIACQQYVSYLYEYTTGQAQEPQQAKQWRQCVDQLLLHPSNVIIHQWISLIHDNSSEATSNSDSNAIINPSNVFTNLLETFSEFQAPPDSTNGGNVMLSSNLKLTGQTNMTVVHELVEYIIEHETMMTTLVHGRNRLLRIYDQVIYIFQQLSLKVWVRYYQQRKSDEVLYNNSTTNHVVSMDKKRPLAEPSKRTDFGKSAKQIKAHSSTRRSNHEALTIPMVDASDKNFQFEEVIELYDQYQIVHITNVMTMPATTQPTIKKADSAQALTWKDVCTIFQKLNDMDQKSWCIETNTTSNKVIIPEKFLSPVLTKDRAYCSFVVQHSKEVYTDVLPNLPFQDFDATLMQYETAIWFFFGRNPVGNISMDGRPEHTDAISHNGTWHYQLSGTKRWSVRPTIELMNQIDCLDGNKVPRLTVNCKEGDVLMINTRLWFHQTIISPQRLPSVSYARDFRINRKGNDQLRGKQSINENCTMTNVDGLYATSDISKGTIIFTEIDMPDCELHRSSTDSNCEVVELEDGTSAVIASRPIVSGEFFCVPESSDDDSDIESDDEAQSEVE
jgi:U3 small nucleolar RNA-associated protein 6